MNPGVVTFDAVGRIRVTTLPPTDFNGGTPSNDGRLCALLGPAPIVAYVGGLPYCAGGQLAVGVMALDHYAPGGIPIGINGRVRVAQNGAIAAYFAGLPFALNQSLVVTTM